MKRILALALFAALSACTPADKILETKPDPLGTFDLGFAIAVAPEPVKGPLSRDATSEEWVDVVKSALTEHFERFDEGSKLYHIAVRVDGYVLAQTGIPIVLSPKSALIINVTFFDDALQAKINEEPIQMTVLENLTGKTLISSGLTQTKETQMRNLAQNAAIQIERYMRENEELFSGPADPAPEGGDATSN